MQTNAVVSELRKFVAPEFIFGVGARNLCGRYAKNFGTQKVLLVTDPGLLLTPWPADIIKSLETEGLQYALYSKISPNPREDEVMQGAETYLTEQCNGIVALGGGSVMDCAKGIGIVSSNRRHISKFEGVDQVLAPMPPLICIPTTGGTSADVSQFAIFTNTQRHVKYAIISKAVVPDVSLIDPATLLTMDTYLSACTGMDALVHAIEAYTSSAHSMVTDVHALEAIRLLHQNLIPSLSDQTNIDLRSKIMAGSLQAGLAFSNASLGGVHAMAHSLGGLLDLPHGECNALLLDHVMAYNYVEAGDRYEAIGAAMNLDLRGMTSSAKKQAILNEVTRMRQTLGIFGTLGNKGVRSSDVTELAEKALKDPCIVTNPRHPNLRDIEVIYEEAL